MDVVDSIGSFTAVVVQLNRNSEQQRMNDNLIGTRIKEKTDIFII